MDAIVSEWGNLLRWIHMIAGMAWIGSSFYFMHLDFMHLDAVMVLCQGA